MPVDRRDRRAIGFQTRTKIDRSNRSAPAVMGSLKTVEKESGLEPIPEDKESEINHGPSSKRLEKTNLPIERVFVDPVIEHWYTDPYNRYDPEGPSGVALRRKVLTTALRNRGFRGPRVASIANWLVRCNGTFKKYEDLVGSNRWKTRNDGEEQSRYSANRGSVGVPKAKTIKHESKSSCDTSARSDKGMSRQLGNKREASRVRSEIAAYPSPVSMRAASDNGQRTEDAIAERIHDDDVDRDVDDDTQSMTSSIGLNEEDEAVCQQLSEEFGSAHSNHKFQTTHAPGTQAYRDAHDDWLLARLRRTQEFWNIVYGDDLDQQDSEAKDEVKFTYFCNQSALPTVDMQYPSQGLRPIKSVMYKGREVWTEDKNFGLYVPEKKDRLK